MTGDILLNDVGIANPLGCGKEIVARELFTGTRDGLVERDDLIPGRSV